MNKERLLEDCGIRNTGNVHWNLSVPKLYEEALKNGEGEIVSEGPFVTNTGIHTGRSPNDKFIVKEDSTQNEIWWGKVNRPISEEKFDQLHQKVLSYLQGKNLYVRDCYAGAAPEYRISVRIINTFAWHNVFIGSLLLPPETNNFPEDHQPDFTIIDVPEFQAISEVDDTNSETFILVNFAKKLVLIGGTKYAGEMKKSVFTYLNYLLPKLDVFPMHCSANVGEDGDVAIFFGLSGTGKTTLSSAPGRALIGDDEHGWSDNGIFNFEGGCYAKTIRLSAKAEPEIYACTKKFGTILENVVIDPETRLPDLDDGSLTENTRAGYPVTHLENIVPEGIGGHPKNLIMLTCDAFGVMPPVAKLTPEQAMYHFLSGYTAKVAGTERGLGNEP
ncbi:MAG: phosphoenolpyruvate carboxykinase (ATP), partial [Candidatus Poribacteria bacterium]|nr:phosphoenolpyruvate carboxykinase (ATP) [Candidatus Poribacteria bacterium]